LMRGKGNASPPVSSPRREAKHDHSRIMRRRARPRKRLQLLRAHARRPARRKYGRENVSRSDRPNSLCCICRHQLRALSVEDIRTPSSSLYNHRRSTKFAYNVPCSFFVVTRSASLDASAPLRTYAISAFGIVLAQAALEKSGFADHKRSSWRTLLRRSQACQT